MTYQLCLLKRFTLLAPSGAELVVSSKKLQVLIAKLALANGVQVARSELVELLWGDRPEAQARNSLRQVLTALRKLAGTTQHSPFIIDTDWVSVDPAALRCDIDGFLVNSSGIDIDRETDIPTGEFLSGLNLPDPAVENWLREQRIRFRDLTTERLSKTASGLMDGDNYPEAVVLLRALLTLEPTHEWAHRQMMHCHIQAGDRSLALAQFQACRAALMQEFGAEPEAETQLLYHQILDGTEVGKSGSETQTKTYLTEKPSIAVLPFENISEQTDQDYFVDGLSRSITSGLARFRDLLVIASQSSFVYKDRKTPLAQIGRELGVCYLLDGSVQVIGNRARISVQLIDSTCGAHLWVEQYDRLLDDVFEVQDDVRERIVGSVASGYGGRLRMAWKDLPTEARPANFQAFDCFMKGLETADQYSLGTKNETVHWFKKATEIDPGYAKPWAKLAWVHILEAVEGWGDDYSGAIQRGFELAQKAVRIDPVEPWSYWVLGGYHFYVGEQEKGMALIHKAHELNPNDAEVLLDLGYYRSYFGEVEQGLEDALKAFQLNPFHPVWYKLQMVQIQFQAGAYKDAVAMHGQVQEIRTALSLLYLAASYAALGQGEKAREVIEAALKEDPYATVSKWTAQAHSPYRREEDRVHFTDNLRLAGLPD
ncbi:MAG: hypothetical protein GY952_13640 [Rhodobacteraceae bacterium]|nr:hypothetical protein [Paracoccaceae bacterium]